MIIITKKKIFYFIILLWFWGIVFPTRTSAQEVSLTYTSLLSLEGEEIYQQNQESVTRLLHRFCKKVYQNNYKNYDPRQSIFVTISCGSLTGWYEVIEAKENGENPIVTYLGKKNRWEMGLYCPTGQQVISDTSRCVPPLLATNANNTIDYNYLFLTTIKSVLNDRTNIAISRLYGLQNPSEEDDNIINEYIAQYFQTTAKIAEQKSYPKTYNKMKDYIKGARKLLKSTYLINTKKTTQEDSISTLSSSNLCLWRSIFTSGKDESTQCKKPQDYDDQISIINILYNELFFYTLFSGFYEQYLTDITTPSNNDSQETAEIKKLLSQSHITQDNITILIQSTNLTIKELLKIQSSFPIHIGFLLYQEDLYRLRKNISNIYLPFHQLHYKLENVQSKD